MSISLSAIWTAKCPNCKLGEMFVKPFRLSKPLDMNQSCKECNFSFEPEPGFYYGAMFISYIVTSFLFLGIALLLVFYFKWTVESAMIVVIIIGGLIYFKMLRLSRAIWLHLIAKIES